MEPLARENIRLAASVLVVRDVPAGGIELFMLQRPGQAVFPNLHVFPGGKVDESDFLPDICVGIDDERASRSLGVSAGGIRYWVAVVRECFEECGVLLARSGMESRSVIWLLVSLYIAWVTRRRIPYLMNSFSCNRW